MSVQGPSSKMETSTNIPTEMRKRGMKSALPKNSILFINADECGINLFSANPAAKAPMIGSIPPSSTRNPEANTTNNTKIKVEYFSGAALLKNHLAKRGTTTKIITEKTINDNSNLAKKAGLTPPSLLDKMIAKIISTAVSVKIVPPTVIATVWLRAMPILLTMGYATSVWVENILAVRKLAFAS